MEDLNYYSKMNLLSIMLKILSFQEFKALDSKCSRLHQQIQTSCKALAISSRHLVKSIGEGNLYLDHLLIKDRILESQ